MSRRSLNTNSLLVSADDVPPPPYSQTDLYSCSPRPGVALPHDAASLVSSSSDAGGDVIYTPPLTPRTPRTTSSSTHVDHPPQQQQQQQPLLPQPDATLYFASRPPPLAVEPDQHEQHVLVHAIDVRATSAPDDFAYQDDWAARDVRREDWTAFKEHLLPDPASRAQPAEAVPEKKPRTEAADEAGSASRRPQVEAQPGDVRENRPTAETRTRSGIAATVQQWNDGFFGPRRMRLVLGEESGSGQQQVDDYAGVASGLGGLSLHHDDGDDGKDGTRPPRDDIASHAMHNRSSSMSSTCSAASSSSSASSLGSLPDYNDINDHRLPLYAARLQDWASRPDEMPTRNEVKALKAELRASSPPGTTTRQQTRAEKKALRAQIKALRTHLKRAKRAQKQERRAHKRELRRKRRAEKKETRQQRRAERRQTRRQERHRGTCPPVVVGVPVPSTTTPSHLSPQHHRIPFFFGPDALFDRRRGPPCPPRLTREQDPPPGPAPAARYHAARQLEAQMDKMATRAAGLGPGAEKHALEESVRVLARNRDSLRMAADEEYARELGRALKAA